jgi:hypothetical protein
MQTLNTRWSIAQFQREKIYKITQICPCINDHLVKILFTCTKRRLLVTKKIVVVENFLGDLVSLKEIGDGPIPQST